MRIAGLHNHWQKFVDGDKEIFGKIYELSRPALTFFCLGILKDLQQAENCASDALLKTYDLKEPEKVKDIESWLFTVARNLCISQLRLAKRHENALQELKQADTRNHEPDITQRYEQSNIDRILRDELAQEDQEIWKLHSEGYTNDEIAHQLNMNKKTVANKKSKIRNSLKTVMKNYLKSRE